MERKVTLGEVGSPDAPPGSRSWAVYVRDEMVSRLIDASQDAWLLEINRNAMVRHEGWRVLTDRAGQPFRSYEAFCVAPQPFGLGYPPTVIDRIIAERKAQAVQQPGTIGEQGGDRRSEAAKAATQQDQPAISRLKAYGTSNPEYIVARLNRDHPDLLAKLQAGEIASPRAAGIEAGFVKRTATVRVDDPSATARALARRFGPDDLRTIAAELLTIADATPPAAP